MTKEETDKIREMYPPGTRIILHRMPRTRVMSRGLEGYVSSVDEDGQIIMRWENGSRMPLIPGEDTFEVAQLPGKLTVLLVEPGKYPKVTEINDVLEEMQALVGGYIEEYSPFDDEVSLVCCCDGKLQGLELNRVIYDEKIGEALDAVAGSFFIVGAPRDSENYCSLTEEQQERYLDMFRYPEHITAEHGRISVEKYRPAGKESER